MRDDVLASCLQHARSSAFLMSVGLSILVHSCPLLDVVQSVLLLSAAFPSTFQGSLKDGLGKTVVAGYVAKPCQLPPLDGC